MLFTALGLIFLCGLISCKNADYASNPSVILFQEYIQINTTTYNDLGVYRQRYSLTTRIFPLDGQTTWSGSRGAVGLDADCAKPMRLEINGGGLSSAVDFIGPAVKFWRKLANTESLTLKEYEYRDGMPVLVIKWPGSDSSLNSIVLNSHMDVVPAAEEDGWTYPPFSGHLTEDGFIYGRGTQDMKSISIQYFEAMKKLKAKGTPLLRDVYMTLMPDEEVGGEDGMVPLLDSEEFKTMNVGLVIDEGGPAPLPMIGVLFQDKIPWQIRVDCHGVAGHGSTFPSTASTATGKCNKVINNLFAYRDEQYKVAATAPITDAGIYTSVNLNRITGGTANNVIPNLVSLTFDIRLSTRLNEDNFQQMLENMINEAGDDIDITYILKSPQSPATIANASNPYWNAITKAAGDMGLIVLPAIPSGATDSRYVRSAGIPAFGVSPMPNTPLLLHAVDERLSAETFLNGIHFYENLISAIANIPAEATLVPTAYLYDTRVY